MSAELHWECDRVLDEHKPKWHGGHPGNGLHQRRCALCKTVWPCAAVRLAEAVLRGVA